VRIPDSRSILGGCWAENRLCPACRSTFLVVEHRLPTRQELPPDDVVVVIRAGVLSEESIEDAANRCLEGYGVLGISVEGAMDLSVSEACRTSPRLGRYRQIRLSSFGRLRAAGFAVIATFDAPHYTIALSDLSELTLARLIRCFDEPIPNPGLGRQQ
jgi:hypothetical protein